MSPIEPARPLSLALQTERDELLGQVAGLKQQLRWAVGIASWIENSLNEQDRERLERCRTVAADPGDPSGNYGAVMA